jgi:hypothetical protein
MAESPRRFPAPWRADKMPGGYAVRDPRRSQFAAHQLRHLMGSRKCTGPPPTSAAWQKKRGLDGDHRRGAEGHRGVTC